MDDREYFDKVVSEMGTYELSKALAPVVLRRVRRTLVTDLYGGKIGLKDFYFRNDLLDYDIENVQDGGVVNG